MNNYSVENHFSQLDNLYKSNTELKVITCVLQNLTHMMKNDQSRSELTPLHWKIVSRIAEVGLQILTKNSFEVDELDFLAELFRFLRNSCAGSAKNQSFILNSSEIFACGKKAVTCFLNGKNEKDITILKCCLQLFGNIVCTGNNSKSLIWNLFMKEFSFRLLFEHEAKRVQEYGMMVLYNCMSDETARYLTNTKEGHDILIALTNSLCDNLVDWGILFFEMMLKYEEFMSNCYETLPARNRLLILDIITEQVNSMHDNSYFFVPNASITYIKEHFIEYAMNIMKVCESDSKDLKAMEIVKTLSILCAASVLDEYSSVLKTDQGLLEISLDTLKSIHLLGKKSCNAFSCISSLKLTNQISKEEIECHPSYGFKKNLIRLIGNLCYNCRSNQDMVRNLDGIPLLLDCCNLDARNPFIMQWCILAIRNILEKNSENQAVLAGISVSGDLVDSALIKELGFQFHNENGKFLLKPLQCL